MHNVATVSIVFCDASVPSFLKTVTLCESSIAISMFCNHEFLPLIAQELVIIVIFFYYYCEIDCQCHGRRSVLKGT